MNRSGTDCSAPATLLAASLASLAMSLAPATARADGLGLGVEALFNASALTSKPHDPYADQPGSAIGGMLRARGAFLKDFRWIVGGTAEQVQRGAMFRTASEHGTRYGGQVGLGWMPISDLRIECVFEGGERSNGSLWFSYWGVRPALTWMRHSSSGLGLIASLGLVLRKESQNDFGPIAPASGREVGASFALGLSYE